MAKGETRRVVVVKSPDMKYFEQAIFIVKEEVLISKSVNSEDIVRQACKVADEYIRSQSVRMGKKGKQKSRLPLYIVAAVAAAVAVWALAMYFVL